MSGPDPNAGKGARRKTMLPDDWDSLTPEERMEARFKGWMSTEDKEFATEEAAQGYERRARRLYETIRLRKADRAPVIVLSGNIAADYAGLTKGDFFYDYDKAVEAVIKFHRDFALEHQAVTNFMPGPVYDRLDYKLYKWPGGNMPDHITFQAIEGEYMKADEYDALIADPEGFLMRTYTPRVMGALEGLQMLPSFINTTEMPFVPFMLAPYLAPPVGAAFEALLEAAQEAGKWFGANGQIAAVTQGELGLPGLIGGFAKAPFDFIGDTLRGTRGIMLDMYRQPEKLLEACERLVPLAVQMAVINANASGNPMCFIVMHKGADGFMSNQDFAKFYWPTLKAVMLGMMEEGVVPFCFVEGGYNQRLDILAESSLPAGRTAWLFDKTDLQAAKEKLGDWACIGGNVPASLFKAGTPQQMRAYVKDIMEKVAGDGGYFLSPGAVLDDVEMDNLHAYFEAGREYGQY
jgi:uroporphyrinogen-III decarboxylase